MAKKLNLADAVKQASRPEKQQPKTDLPPQSAAPARQQNRTGKRNISAWFEEPVHRQLKMLAAEQGKSQQEMMAESLNMLFERYKKNPIA